MTVTVASTDEIPYPLIAVVAEVFSKQYTHTEIDSRFYYANFPPEPPPETNSKNVMIGFDSEIENCRNL
jgi:hypothetical protein